MLGDSGFQVRACSSFGEALGCLRRDHYRLAIVDLSLSRTSNAGLGGRGRPETPGGLPAAGGDQGGRNAGDRPFGVDRPGLDRAGIQPAACFAFLEKQAFNRRVFFQTVQEALDREGGSPELDLLTEREREVMDLLAKGLTNKEIADSLVITTNTVKRHLKSIFVKLDIHTRSAAVAKVKGE